MGLRLNRFQEYFRQARPLKVTCQIGKGLSSNYSIVVQDMRQVSDDQAVLLSNAGEISLHEEEIYKLVTSVTEQTFSLVMDGGTELKFTPLSGSSYSQNS